MHSPDFANDTSKVFGWRYFFFWKMSIFRVRLLLKWVMLSDVIKRTLNFLTDHFRRVYVYVTKRKYSLSIKSSCKTTKHCFQFKAMNFLSFDRRIKVKFLKLWQVDHFLLWGFFKFITRKEPNRGNFRQIFSPNNCSEKIYANNFRCWALLLG